MKHASDDKSAYWQQHIHHWQASKLSAAHYCQQHQVTYHCFIYWRSKLTRQSEATVDQPLTGKGRSAFVVARSTVQASPVTETTPLAENLQLALPNGLVIQNIRDGNLSTVRALLDHL